MLEMFPEWLRIFIMSTIPWFESRYAIPIAMEFGWQWWEAFPIAVAGNLLPIPFILLFFKYVEKFLRRFKFWADVMDKLFAITRKRADKKIRRYEHLGLLLFVALPVPFTGAWTGALIAYLFNLMFSRSLITIFFGVLMAASIMTIITLTGIDILITFIGVVITGIIMAIILFAGVKKLDKEG
jgi:uncharacterized membrane protein